MTISQARLKIALTISAMVNLFAVGVAVGVVFGRLDLAHGVRGGAQAQPTLWAVAASLPPAERAALRDLLRERARTLAPETRETREARREAARVIAAPTYNAVAAQSALTNVRTREIRVRGEIDATLLDFVARLGAPARAALAEAVVRGRIGPAARPAGSDGPGSAAAPLKAAD